MQSHNLQIIQTGLEQLGLSAKQVEIYLLLVTRKDLRIQEIAKLSAMPRSSVYENLRHLHELGLVEETIDDNFKRVRAYPVGVLRHELDEQIAALMRQVDNLNALETAIGHIGTQENPTNVRYYKGRTGARQIYWNTLKTNDTVYVYSEWGRQQYVGLKFYERFANENRSRGLQEKVLINPTPQILDMIKLHSVPQAPYTRTRVEDIRVLASSIVHIKGDTIIYNDVYAQVYLKNVEIHGFEIESQDFVETQRSIFRTLWEQAKPLSDFLDDA